MFAAMASTSVAYACKSPRSCPIGALTFTLVCVSPFAFKVCSTVTEGSPERVVSCSIVRCWASITSWARRRRGAVASVSIFALYSQLDRQRLAIGRLEAQEELINLAALWSVHVPHVGPRE